jgi:hypothetical protein
VSVTCSAASVHAPGPATASEARPD